MRRPVLFLFALGLAALVFAPGEAKSTVEEQRARLPPPADCSDPVEGAWLALTYTAKQGMWYEETLNVHREAPGSNKLKGTMLSHFWRGSPTDQKPPACTIGQLEALVRMPDADGTIDAKGFIEFGAHSWVLDKTFCGTHWGTYYPDHYSGTIDPARQEFQSVNNDGGEIVNEPTVFRRVSCFDKPHGTGVSVKPPEYEPKRRGCGR